MPTVSAHVAITLAVMALMLTEHGFTVHVAETGGTGLEMARRLQPDLALVDICLSGAVDGVSVAAELAPLGVLIIFVTADYQRAAEGREYAADILIKPVRYSALIGAVAAALSGADRWH